MQRRAAAAYAAFFILVAVGAYAMIGVAQEPAVSISNPDYSLSSGDEVRVNGRLYTASVSGGSAEFTWVNDSARFTATWENGSTITREGTEFTVETFPNATPPSVYLTEVQALPENVTTQDIDGVTYVVLQQEDGPPELVPREQYLRDRFGDPTIEIVQRGDEVEHENRTATVEAVTEESATLAWIGERENTVSADEGSNVTLNGRTFVAHFPDDGTVELESNYRAYANEVQAVDTYHERVNGLWGVTILSAFTAMGIIGLAFLPSRY